MNMNMIYNIGSITPLNKERLKKYKNDKEAQDRMNIIKGYVQQIYSETIKTAINGYTNYTFSLSNKRYLHNQQYIFELIFELHIVFTDLNIYYTEKNVDDIQDIQDNKTIIPCIVIDWS